MGSVRPIAVEQRRAFDRASIRDYGEAQRVMQEAFRGAVAEPESVQGWLNWQLAEYMQLTDPVQAQQILKAALQLNRRLAKPIDGMVYQKLNGKDLSQAREITWKLKSYAGKPNNLLIHVNGILDDLNFVPDNADHL
jgi:Tfp pilus assembly protein PilF